MVAEGMALCRGDEFMLDGLVQSRESANTGEIRFSENPPSRGLGVALRQRRLEVFESQRQLSQLSGCRRGSRRNSAGPFLVPTKLALGVIASQRPLAIANFILGSDRRSASGNAVRIPRRRGLLEDDQIVASRVLI